MNLEEFKIIIELGRLSAQVLGFRSFEFCTLIGLLFYRSTKGGDANKIPHEVRGKRNSLMFGRFYTKRQC